MAAIKFPWSENAKPMTAETFAEAWESLLGADKSPPRRDPIIVSPTAFGAMMADPPTRDTVYHAYANNLSLTWVNDDRAARGIQKITPEEWKRLEADLFGREVR